MELVISKYCSISQLQASVNSQVIFDNAQGQDFKTFIRALYKQSGLDYPKFFKMDNLSKLGFMSVELLLQGENILGRYNSADVGIILTNASSSLEIDQKHYSTIKDREQYFPSPSNFVYTLPNIMAGESAIKNKFKGENTLMITKGFDPQLIHNIAELAFSSGVIESCICGWVEQNNEQFESVLFLIERKRPDKFIEGIIFEPSMLLNIYKQELEWKN